MRDHPSDITDFLELILEALESAGVDYLIGGAVAEWAWGEPRATQDLDFVIHLRIKAINKFSKELEKRHMLVPAEIMLDAMMEDRADIPINAIHMYTGFKADLSHARDIASILYARKEELDFTYIEEWVPQLGLGPLWKEILDSVS